MVNKKRTKRDEDKWKKLQTFALIADAIARVLGPLFGR